MKEILEKIYEILRHVKIHDPSFDVGIDKVIRKVDVSEMKDELKKLIDELPDDDEIEGKLSESEKGFLRGDVSGATAKIIKAGSKGTLDIK